VTSKEDRSFYRQLVCTDIMWTASAHVRFLFPEVLHDQITSFILEQAKHGAQTQAQLLCLQMGCSTTGLTGSYPNSSTWGNSTVAPLGIFRGQLDADPASTLELMMTNLTLCVC